MRAQTTLRHARLNRQEIAGAHRDLGTFLTLLVGMAGSNDQDYAT